jgi:NADH dehydrogenase [ubiquinone] 1 alpha subcomplex assembly factor 1
MKTFLLLLATAMAATAAAAADDTLTIFDFSQEADLRGWEIQDDVVMGGVSQGRFTVNEEGHAVFSGNVSLENDGGFSSFQYNFGPVDVSPYRAICIRLKSDGKPYQLRVESEPNVRHGYAFNFNPSGDWQVIEIPFADMYAIRHGDRLDLPNYPGQTLAQVQILIGNGKAETFQLEIDKIWVK